VRAPRDSIWGVKVRCQSVLRGVSTEKICATASRARVATCAKRHFPPTAPASRSAPAALGRHRPGCMGYSLTVRSLAFPTSEVCSVQLRACGTLRSSAPNARVGFVRAALLA